MYMDHTVVLWYLVRYIQTLLDNSHFSCHPLSGIVPRVKNKAMQEFPADWMLNIVCSYPFICMYVIVVHVIIVSNGSCMYDLMSYVRPHVSSYTDLK